MKFQNNRAGSFDFLLEYDEWQKLRNSTSAENFRYLARKVAGYLFGKLQADAIAFYCTGFQPGVFSPISSIPPENKRVYVSTLDRANDAVEQIHSVKPTKQHSAHPYAISSDEKTLRVWLVGRGEFFGFIEIRKEKRFHEGDINFLENQIAELIRYVAEENFSFRMHILLEKFDGYRNEVIDEQQFYSSVARQVALGFGADGTTFRVLDEENDLLVAKSFSGHAKGLITEPRSPNELVSGKILGAGSPDVVSINIAQPELDSGNIAVSRLERERLASVGIFAMVVGRLFRKDAGGADIRFGTLSYFFMRPHRVSRRDLDLFSAFCRRVSDTIFISQTIGELRSQAAILQEQSRRMTYIEVANLLAHDLWHKGFNAWHASKENEALLRKYIATDRLRGAEPVLDALLTAATEVVELTNAVHSTSSNLHSLQMKPSEDIYRSVDFQLADAIGSVEETLRPALTRQNISLNLSVAKDHKLNGPRFIFEQVIFNLMINSIDAAKGRKTSKPMAINIHSHQERDRLIIRYSDEGPGIDPIRFPDLQTIFEIGATNKKDGTGTGLSVARQLIGTHFSGHLSILERRPPLFTINVPSGIKG